MDIEQILKIVEGLDAGDEAKNTLIMAIMDYGETQYRLGYAVALDTSVNWVG